MCVCSRQRVLDRDNLKQVLVQQYEVIVDLYMTELDKVCAGNIVKLNFAQHHCSFVILDLCIHVRPQYWTLVSKQHDRKLINYPIFGFLVPLTVKAHIGPATWSKFVWMIQMP